MLQSLEYKFDVAAPEPYDFGYLGDDPSRYTPVPFKPQTHESDPQGGVLERMFWTANQASEAVWRTAAMLTPCRANSPAMAASTPARSATSRLTW